MALGAAPAITPRQRRLQMAASLKKGWIITGFLLLAAAAANAAERRVVVEVNLGVNAWQAGLATGTFRPRAVSPSDRPQVHQSLSLGYQIRPRVRLQVALMFAETVNQIRP